MLTTLERKAFEKRAKERGLNNNPFLYIVALEKEFKSENRNHLRWFVDQINAFIEWYGIIKLQLTLSSIIVGLHYAGIF